MITVDDFAKLEIKVGTVLEVDEMGSSDKLITQVMEFDKETLNML